MSQSQIQSYLERAHGLGSKATTLRGAGNFILSQTRSVFSHPPTGRWGRKATKAEYRAEHHARRVVAAFGHLDRLPSFLTPADRKILRAKIDARRLAAAAPRLRQIFSSSYRTAQGSWAGGETAIDICRSDISGVRSWTRTAWSKNGRWRGNNLNISLFVPPYWARHVDAVPGLANAGGMLTVAAKRIAGQDAWHASWVVQGRGFDLRTESGVILRTPEGEFIHGKSLTSCQSTLKRRANTAAQAEQKASRAAAVRALSVHELRERYADIEIRVTDSVRAGNCRTGTENWVEIHFPGRTSATVAEILAADTQDLVLRAVRAGIVRSRVALS